MFIIYIQGNITFWQTEQMKPYRTGIVLQQVDLFVLYLCILCLDKRNIIYMLDSEYSFEKS